MLVFGLCLLCECPSALKRNEKINWSPQAFWSGQLHTDQFCIFCFLGICQRYPHTHTLDTYIRTHTQMHRRNHTLQYCHVSIYTYQLGPRRPFWKLRFLWFFFFCLFIIYQHHQERHSLLTDESVRRWTFNPPPVVLKMQHMRREMSSTSSIFDEMFLFLWDDNIKNSRRGGGGGGEVFTGLCGGGLTVHRITYYMTKTNPPPSRNFPQRATTVSTKAGQCSKHVISFSHE